MSWCDLCDYIAHTDTPPHTLRHAGLFSVNRLGQFMTTCTSITTHCVLSIAQHALTSPLHTLRHSGPFPANRLSQFMTSSTSIDLSLAHRELVILGECSWREILCCTVFRALRTEIWSSWMSAADMLC